MISSMSIFKFYLINILIDSKKSIKTVFLNLEILEI